tara:strand:- start:326 stop:757 length:432 start_codon:yes stop_codon:yes gene_type:complete
MELITVRSFEKAIEAHMVKSRLESEGIPVYLFDEHTVGLNPLFNLSVDGIKLKVHPQDVELAQEIIEDFIHAPHENSEGEPLLCSECGSADFYESYQSMKGRKGFLSIIVSFLLGVYPIYYRTVIKCKSCGNEMEIQHQESEN